MFQEIWKITIKFSLFYIYCDLSVTGLRTLFHFLRFKISKTTTLQCFRIIYAVKCYDFYLLHDHGTHTHTHTHTHIYTYIYICIVAFSKSRPENLIRGSSVSSTYVCLSHAKYELISQGIPHWRSAAPLFPPPTTAQKMEIKRSS
jgi:hypothetical protein